MENVKVVLTNKDMGIIKYALLPSSGPKKWIILNRSIKSKLEIPDESSFLKVTPHPEGGAKLRFENIEKMLESKTVEFTPDEVEYLKVLVQLFDEQGQYNDFNFDSLEKIEKL